MSILRNSRRYHKEYSNEDFLDIYETRKIRDSEAISIIKDLCNVDQSIDIQNPDKDVRDKNLIELKNRGLSTRQIAKLTGVGRSIVMKL
ncbi:hypothetical protein [Alkaliphilus metalliredigens]|uniref:hypothetical protein n=1 Tax=Alkaliphilus metalliredigens TaxID=208226 RepID=UPI00005CD479|nr:hypothetical protein [Alkaliphilus metalliredigens]